MSNTISQAPGWILHRPATMTQLVAFFGGFLDGTFRPVKDVVAQFVRESRYGPHTGILYFSWFHAWCSNFARREIAAQVQNAGLPRLAIVGHSYGAHSAHKLALRLNLPVDVLVTIDGVSWEGKLLRCQRPAAVKNWINVYKKGIRHSSDVVALVGGHWGSTSAADHNIHVPQTTHAEFGKMFREAEHAMKELMGLA